MAKIKGSIHNSILLIPRASVLIKNFGTKFADEEEQSNDKKSPPPTLVGVGIN